jgi:hypothetical protein
MKRTSLSKSFRIFGLMAMLSVLVATTLQQPIQAKSKVQPKTPTACVPLASGVTFYDLQGLEFSPKQQVEYKKITDAAILRSEALDKRIKKSQSKGYLVTAVRGEIDDKIRNEIGAATAAVEADGIPDAKQLKELTKKYGQYATFSIEPLSVLTPKQIVERDKITRDMEDQIMSILTPEQQKVFRANLVIKRGIEACRTE